MIELKTSAALALLVLSAVAAGPGQVLVRFHFAPLQHWNDGQPARKDWLPEATVRLYRPGDHLPAATLDANTVVEVPGGSWRFLAEAPGFVTYGSGLINATAEAMDPEPRSVLWPMIPACQRQLVEDRRWRSLDRLDVVSLEPAAVFPIAPSVRQALWAPLGRTLVYGVDQRGELTGIEIAEGVCGQQSGSQQIQVPEAPQAGEQALLQSVELPAGEFDVGEFTVRLEPKVFGHPAVVPTISLQLGYHQLGLFFLGISSEEEWTLVVEHPKLRTERVEFASMSGVARELQPLHMQERLSMAVAVDYQPKRDHEIQRLELRQCRADEVRRRSRCSRVVAEFELLLGLNTYSIDQLDSSKFMLVARIDEQTLYGLGSFAGFEIRSEDQQPPVLPVYPLHELEIFGEIQERGKAVAGTVVLRAVFEDYRARTYPTDEELLYHMYYFGELPMGQFVAAREDLGSADEDTRGLGVSVLLQACALDSGVCRSFNRHSYLRGEGRLDLEISAHAWLHLTVLDSETEKPVVGAAVRLDYQDDQALHFSHGEVTWAKPDGAEPSVHFTAANGEAHIALLGPLGDEILVHKKGYEIATAPEPPGGQGATTEVRVLLRRKEQLAETRLVFSGKRGPVAGAALGKLGAEGLDLSCWARTDDQGYLQLPRRCRGPGKFVVMHRAALIQVLDANLLRQAPEVEIQPWNGWAVEVKVQDVTGEAIGGIPLRLRFEEFTLGPNEFIAANKTPYLSRQAGSVAVRGLAAASPLGLPIVESASPAYAGHHRVVSGENSLLLRVE